MTKKSDFVIKNGVLTDYFGGSTNIAILEGVHTIDGCAFRRETRKIIMSIQLPESLEIIDDYAFDFCEKLERIVIPSNVKKIGKGAFSLCTELKEVIFEGAPEIKVTSFRFTPWEKKELKKAGAKITGNRLIKVDPELTEYTIPSNITVIEGAAFRDSKIKELVVPDGVTTLGIGAFAHSAIEHISLPETLMSIGADAFSNCTNLTELTIPKNILQIGADAFDQLPNCVLTILNERDDEKSFRVSTKSFSTNIPCIKEVRVPYGSAAMRYAMQSGLNVTTFPCGPEKFGNPKKYHYIADAFCCEGSTLHEYFGNQNIVYVPNQIDKIGENAFANTKVQKIHLPHSVRSLEKFPFVECEDITEIIGEGVETIDEYAFYKCKHLQKVVFPNLKKCYDISFEYCDNLKRENIIIPDDATVVEVEFEPCICGYHLKHTPFTEQSEVNFQ